MSNLKLGRPISNASRAFRSSGTEGSNPPSSSAESGANLALDRGAGSVPDSGTTPAVVADPDDELHGLPLDIPAGVREE
jgi:hypothetical protein